MQIVNFCKDYVNQAIKLIMEGYTRERDGFFLPPSEKIFSGDRMESILKELDFFASNDLGVAAVENGSLAGFLCAYPPFKGCYNSATESGVWAPVHAHGMANPSDRKTWSFLVCSAMKKWKVQGASYHSITLFSHEKELQYVLGDLCFGRRCEDAFRSLSELNVHKVCDFEVKQIENKGNEKLKKLRKSLVEHLSSAPVFMLISERNFEETCREKEEDVNIVTLGLFCRNELIGFMDLQENGENFISSGSDFLNIHGMFVDDEYRGKNLGNLLVAAGIIEARNRGYSYLGVDYETMNPTAKNFWKKNFNPYTVSMVRRLD